MQTYSSLPSSDTGNSFARQAPKRQRTAKVRLVGGRPVEPVSAMADCPHSSDIAGSKVLAKKRGGVRRKKSESKGCESTPDVKDAARTTTGKRSTCKTVAKPGTRTVAKRVRRSSGTTWNKRSVESMMNLVGEFARNTISACVEQTLSQLIQNGLLVSQYAFAMPVDNGSGSLQSTVSRTNFDQACGFLQPYTDSVLSANNFSASTIPWSGFHLGSAQQRSSDVFTSQSFVSGESLPHTFVSFGSQVEGLVATVAATSGRNTPISSDYALCNSFSSRLDAVGTACYSGVGNYQSLAHYTQPVQSTSLTDYSLTDLLNMSDDDIDTLLSGFVDCLSDNPLPLDAAVSAAAGSAAGTNSVIMALDDAGTYIPVCCNVVTSVTEVPDRCRWPLSLTTVDSYSENMMNIPSGLFSETFDDNMTEAAFQPDYYESDDGESDNQSVARSYSNATMPGVCPTGKKITLKKPCTEEILVAVSSRRKRPWKQSSRNNATSSASSASPVREGKLAVELSSSESSSTRPAAASAPADDESTLHPLEDILEGES